MPWDLTLTDLPDLAWGAALLGTGGGGDPYLGKALAADSLAAAGGPVQFLDPEELPEDALVVTAAMMGAPTVVVEKLPNGKEAALALRALERHLGRPVTATMPAECGGMNSMVPLISAAQLGLPVVDADGMGRAFPELSMTTFGASGLPGSPMAIADEQGSVAVVDAGPDNRRLESLARALAVSMGASAWMALYPMSGADVRRTAVPRTVSTALELGRAVREARESHRDPFAALRETLPRTVYRHGTVVFSGKVVDVDRRTTDGFARGRAAIAADGTGSAEGACELVFQNENLLARIDGRTVAVVPDLVTVLHAESGQPVTTEALSFGQRVRVFVISAPDRLCTPEALAAFGPRAFGLDEDYRPATLVP
ncbi:hypothetical protein DB35_07180 [Streptomyces abyssalis]|uniref:Hydantoinase n=2 Tax=Streptomyces abyssalis TaxID=933944 RepID=A0A1E7JSP5_9ACTN|nr:DUF917 domain-containing protein [Streptomyces abyssalis]OEU91934.1 hypothetical protein AN215_05600 [Streptomyces abyssalis]OEU93923.1 hypothetical protein DB35_07180 [Streptomyces abyssalis]OEV26581.1 hypothetical protein AN219_25005 [Streptomyces nanshensis]